MKKKTIMRILAGTVIGAALVIGTMKGIEVYKDSVFYKTKRVNKIINEVPKNEFMELMYDEEDNTVFVFAESEEGTTELATNSKVGYDAWLMLKDTMIDYNEQLLEYITLSGIEKVEVHTIITDGPTEEIAEIRNGKVYTDSIENLRKIEGFYKN